MVRINKKLLLVVVLTSMAFLSSACGGSSERSLVVYSGRSESLIGPLISQFEEETGIRVAVKYGSTGPLAATLLEEGDLSPADVFFAQDPGGLGAVENLLAKLPSDLLEAVPLWARSEDSNWVGVSGRERVVVYNTERINEDDLPTSIWDFTRPEWNGRLGWAPSNASFQAMVTGMRTIWGEEMTAEWLSGILANNPEVYNKNTPIVDAVGKGEIDVGFVNHYYLYRFIAEKGEGFPARNYYLPQGDPGSIVLVAGAGVVGTTDNESEALEFIRFLIDESSQEYFANETYELPVIDNVNVSPLIETRGFDSVTGISPSQLTDVEGTQALMRQAGILP